MKILKILKIYENKFPKWIEFLNLSKLKEVELDLARETRSYKIEKRICKYNKF